MDFIYCLRNVPEEWELYKLMNVCWGGCTALPAALVKHAVTKWVTPTWRPNGGFRMGLADSPLHVDSYLLNIAFLVHPFAIHFFSSVFPILSIIQDTTHTFQWAILLLLCSQQNLIYIFKALLYLRAAFLSFGTIDALGWVIICLRRPAVQWRVVSSISGLLPTGYQ